MYRVDRNNFYANSKHSTVYTPAAVSEFIFSIVAPHIASNNIIFDPCVGAGALLHPFDRAGYKTAGMDVEEQGYPQTRVGDYLALKKDEIPAPSLVIMNPPFNLDDNTRKYVTQYCGGRPLLPEVWLQKTVELFGLSVPAVLFTPYGLRLNQCENSSRWQRFVRGEYPEISSIISLPKNIFDGVLFHSEILIFNIPDLKAHYFYETPQT